MQTQNREKYEAWWKELGMVLKEGFYMNWEHLDELKKLTLFKSTKSGDKFTSLEEYVKNMPKEQKEIYFLIGENKEAISASPILEAYKNKNFEVLLLSDPIDEFMMNALTEFEGKKFHDISRGDVDFEKTEEEKKSEEASKAEYKDLCSELQKILDANIKEVRVSSRLKDSPCCLVTDEAAMSHHMERMMAAMGQGVTKSKRILEINPNHPICQMLKDKTANKEALEDWPKALYGQAVLAEGSQLENPGEYVQAITKLLSAQIH